MGFEGFLFQKEWKNYRRSDSVGSSLTAEAAGEPAKAAADPKTARHQSCGDLILAY